MSADAGASVDAHALAAWLTAEGALPAGGFVDVEPLAGGSSNPTYRVRGDGVDLVLRRPPARGGLPTAHDMEREYRFQAALADTPVPVAGMVALCRDVDVIGAPFYVMDRLDGVVHAHADGIRELPASIASAAGIALAGTLAELHAVDPVRAGLGSYGRPEPYAVRQLRRWGRQWTASGPESVPLVTDVLAALTARVPDAGPERIVHGDYNLANVMYRRDDPGRVLAVLDWEMAALGAPGADLGQLLAYWGPAGRLLFAERGGHLPDANPALPTRADLIAAYALASGEEPRSVPFWEAFAAIKLAIICAGALRRVADSSTDRRTRIEELVAGLAAIARDTLEE